MAGTVYKYEWLSPRSGFDFKLEFFEGSQLNDWEHIVDLPPTSVELLNIEGYKYDDYTINFGQSPLANLSVDLNILTEPAFSGFNTLILRPKRDAIAVISFDDDSVWQNVEIKNGTIIHFYIKAHGKDAIVPAPWRKIKTFVHRDGIDDEDIWDIITNQVKIKAIDINKFVLDQANFNMLGLRFRNFLTDGPKWTDEIYDFLNSVPTTEGPHTSINHAVTQRKSDIHFEFIPYNDIFYYTERYASCIYRMLMFDITTEIVYTINVPKKKFFKQSYDASGSPGTELSTEDIYRIMQVKRKWVSFNWSDICIGGVYQDNDENSFQNMYKSCWDFLADVFEEHSVKAIYLPNGISYSEALTVNDNAFNVQNILDSAQVGMKINLIGKTTSSLFEFLSGYEYSDISNFTDSPNGNRNSTEKTIPIYENNMPCNVETTRFFRGLNESWTSLQAPFLMEVQDKFHVNKLYYQDYPSSLIKAGASYAPYIRIHEKVSYALKNNLGTIIYNATPGAVSYLDYLQNSIKYNSVIGGYYAQKPEELHKMIAAIQDSGLCIHGVAAKKLNELYGDTPNQFPARKMTVEIPFYDITYLKDDNPIGLGGLDPRAKIIYSLVEINPAVTDSSVDWQILESSLGFMKETVKLTLVNMKEVS